MLDDNSPCHHHVHLEHRVRAVVDAHARDSSPLLPILHDLQQEMGFIHPEAIPAIADALNLCLADVSSIATSFRDFRDRTVGPRRVRICTAQACRALGSGELVAQAQARYQLEFGEFTSDGRISLDEVYCLGNCALGPSVEVDGVVYGRVDGESLHDIVAGHRR